METKDHKTHKNKILSAEEIFDDIIRSALEKRASDIHIDPYASFVKIVFRIDGVLHFVHTMPLEIYEKVISRIKVLARLPLDDRRLPKDGRFEWQNKNYDNEKGIKADIRVSIIPLSFGENAVLRIFSKEEQTFTLQHLGFNNEQISILNDAISCSSGMIILVGPTGSGKTSTLYALLSMINAQERLVMTIEDPIEYRLNDIRQIEVGGTSLLTFQTILRSALRQDPDVIMIGEIRDKETAALAFQSALTGHLVLTTLHASSVRHVNQRLYDLGIADYVIKSTLLISVSQRLVSKICKLCKIEKAVHQDQEFEFFPPSIISEIFYFGAGCSLCGNSGISGRIAVTEFSSVPSPLYLDGYEKAVKGIIPFSEVIILLNEHRRSII